MASFWNIIGDANALVRRRVFEDLGGFTEDYGIGHEDWEFFLKAITHGVRLEVVPEALFHYRIGAVSMLTTTQAERNLFRSLTPLIAAEGAPAGYMVLRYLAEKMGFGPFTPKA
ncbi:glycosyltransferase family 2 protein [Elstera litoralis]|uniref:glycosyltransferase family 2 protein n=1 Tax=Elstera litoralis TaxID=552518 RepID=UPI0018DB6EB0|nr:glycosyltransferase family 2 protein [Elstera litoralis]